MSQAESLSELWSRVSAEAHHSDEVCVFDCDKTLISGDLGEACLRRALKQRWIVSHDAWWRHLDEAEIASTAERRSWRQAYERSQSARSPLIITEQFDPLSGELWEAYELLCQRQITSAYIYAARLAYQRAPHEVSSFAQAALQVDREVSERAQLRDFVSLLHAEGAQVWIVSSSQVDVVQVIARRYQIPSDRVIAIDFERDAMSGRATDRLRLPAPIKEDKVAALKKRSHQKPLLMTGDSWYDLPLMREARFAILIDHLRDDALSAEAHSLGATLIAHHLVEGSGA